MNTNFDKNIQELLRSHTEQPSVDCWNKISSQLDGLQMQNSSSSASQGGNASQFSQFMGSITGKTISAIVGATVIGGMIALVVVNSPENNTQTQNKTIIASEEDIQNDVSILNEEEIQTSKETIALFKGNENTNFENTIYSIGQKDTSNLTENRNILPINTVQNSIETSSVQTETENVDKTESYSKTNNKKRKPLFNNNENATVEESSENEIPQEVIDLPKFTIPNVFIPNGYYFVIEGIEQFPENELYISDRYGNVVYKKINYKNDWGAENIPNGVYFYIFKYVYKGTQFMKDGSVTIRR
jgi:hypothetical protein